MVKHTFDWGSKCIKLSNLDYILLNKKIEAYNKEKKTLSVFECIKDVTVLKEEYKWLKEVDRLILNNSVSSA